MYMKVLFANIKSLTKHLKVPAEVLKEFSIHIISVLVVNQKVAYFFE